VASKISIINFALTLIGGNPISSLEEKSVSASTANLIYGMSLDSILGSHPWTFAIMRKNIEISHNSSPAWGYANSFNLPEDCLRILQVNELDFLPNIDYKVENRRILTDESTVNLLYISNDINIQHASATFVEAFASKIAVNLCGKLADTSTKLTAMAAIYANSLRIAIQANDTETSYVENNSSWVRARAR